MTLLPIMALDPELEQESCLNPVGKDLELLSQMMRAEHEALESLRTLDSLNELQKFQRGESSQFDEMAKLLLKKD